MRKVLSAWVLKDGKLVPVFETSKPVRITQEDMDRARVLGDRMYTKFCAKLGIAPLPQTRSWRPITKDRND